jgi:hypothetical protein
MPSAGLERPTDDFWLAAHDGVGVKSPRVIGDRPFGLGLATGLLAELVHGGWCQLWDGQLFRTAGADQPRDAALRALLDKMAQDEKHWPPTPVPPASRTYVGVHVRAPYGLVWPPVPRQDHPAGRGHQLRDWIAYLANKRAETLVGERLTRSGLARPEQHGLVIKRTRYVPRDTNVTGRPASRLQIAAQRGSSLSWSDRVLAGLCLATGLHQHALYALTSGEHDRLLTLIKGLDGPLRELIRAADAAVGDAAAVR